MDNVETFVSDLLALDLEDKDKVNEITKNLTEDGKAGVETALRSLQAVRDEITPEHMTEIAALFGWTPPTVEPVAVEEPAAVAEDDSEPAQEIPAEVQKSIDEKDAELAEIKKQLDDEREARIVKEYAEAAAGYTLPGLDAATMGTVLRAVDGLPAENAEAVKGAFKAASELVEKSAAMTEIGTTAADDDDNGAKLEKIAKSIQAENENLTFEQCYARALKANPELY